MGTRTVERHALWVRVTHAVNAACLVPLLMSGLQIFDADPAWYLGNASDFAHPLVLLPSVPHWLTLPGYQDLATGRLWHFFLAWILVINGALYLSIGLLSGHIARDLLPRLQEVRGIGASLRAHLHLRFPAGEQAHRYNPLQKLSYLLVAFLFLPLMLVTGLAMSPAIDAAVPGLPWLLLGRQTARTLHGITALLLVLFVLVHLVMVVVSGLGNNLRGIVTGRIRTPDRP